ncbi:hypothetical protein Tco_0924881 [Tanacetum coccineum]|uniref:Uncharacterized protein n=1 Tax=Tanacetum coccineum TaxID=301880 RepID=A0ABQ5D6M3_9ASTR
MSETVSPIPPRGVCRAVRFEAGFDVEDFSSWKDRFLVCLDGLKPYLVKILENGPFVAMLALSTSTNPLTKPQKQWSSKDRRLANHDKRLKHIVISCLPNNVMKSVIKCTTAKDSDLDVEEGTRSRSKFLADLNVEFHDRALLANQKRFYKWFGRDEGVTKVKAFMAIAEDDPSVGKGDTRLDYTHVDYHYVEDQRKNLLSKFNSLNQELSSFHQIKLENESLKDEINDLKKVIEKWTSSKVTLDQLLTKQVLGNIVHALGGRGKKKDTISSKEVLFSKATEFHLRISLRSPLTLSLNHYKCDKATRAKEFGVSNLETSAVSEEIKKVPTKRSAIKVPKKKAQTVSPSAPDPIPVKKVDSSTEQLLLTLMVEVKGLKEQIKIPSDTSPSVSQSGSSKSAKGKQKTWFRPCKHCGFRNYLSKDCYMKPK